MRDDSGDDAPSLATIHRRFAEFQRGRLSTRMSSLDVTLRHVPMTTFNVSRTWYRQIGYWMSDV